MDFFIGMQKIAPQKFITILAGLLATVSWPPIKNFLIARFVAVYNVDMTEAMALSITQYATFNDFFTRELKTGARPINQEPLAVVSPADGVISELGTIHNGQMMQAKGIDYSVARLLGNEDMAKQLEGGEFATVYLSPKDYHRVHMPIDGQPLSLKYIPGKLFSVNQRTAGNVDSLLARNERLVATFRHGEHLFAVVLVGAMIVGGMETVLTGKIKRDKTIRDLNFQRHGLDKGAEFGRFYLGSTAIILFPKEINVVFNRAESSERAKELYSGSAVQMGERIASYSL